MFRCVEAGPVQSGALLHADCPASAGESARLALTLFSIRQRRGRGRGGRERAGGWGGGENERRRASERVSERKQPKSEDGDTRYKVLNCLVHTHCQGVIPLCRYTQTLQRYFL